MDQLCMKINTDVHVYLLDKNFKLHQRHPTLRKLLAVIFKK